MKPSTSWFWIFMIVLYCLVCCVRGCPFAQSIEAAKLPGVWRSSDQGIDVIWTFEPSGSFRYQTQFQSSWVGFLGGNIDIIGYWKLDRNRLTMELSETPPAVTLAGGSWKGKATTLQINRLTDTELTFSDSDFRFRRSLVPAEK